MLGTVSLKTEVLVNLCWDSSSLVQESSPTVQCKKMISTQRLVHEYFFPARMTPQFGVSQEKVFGQERVERILHHGSSLAVRTILV